MKNLLSILAIGALAVFSSCGGNQIQTLSFTERKSILEKTEGMKPIDPETLRAAIGHLASDPSVTIPSSYMLDQEALNALLGANEAGVVPSGLMAYPMIESGQLKIALVPYYTNNKGVLVHESDLTKLGAYNYSSMCPPYAGCIANASQFGATKLAYTFYKCE